jgi:hypothetical protein
MLGGGVPGHEPAQMAACFLIAYQAVIVQRFPGIDHGRFRGPVQPIVGPEHAADADLTRKIRTIHAASRKTYGAPRIHAELKAEGVAIGKKRVARLMGAAGLVGASRRRSVTTTRRDPGHRPANDLVRRNFFVEKPNELWVADITFVPTLAGFLFLAVVMDAWSAGLSDGPSLAT